MDFTPAPSFLVYWQQPGPQLFAFTLRVQAATPIAARSYARRSVVGKTGRILGVKQSAGTGLRTLNRGRWIG